MTIFDKIIEYLWIYIHIVQLKNIRSQIHKDSAKYKVQNVLVLKFLKESSSENSVNQAEMIFASFIVKHNILIASTENAGALFRAMIAKKYVSA